jgi:hypothetical protein
MLNLLKKRKPFMVPGFHDHRFQSGLQGSAALGDHLFEGGCYLFGASAGDFNPFKRIPPPIENKEALFL